MALNNAYHRQFFGPREKFRIITLEMYPCRLNLRDSMICNCKLQRTNYKRKTFMVLTSYEVNANLPFTKLTKHFHLYCVVFAVVDHCTPLHRSNFRGIILFVLQFFLSFNNTTSKASLTVARRKLSISDFSQFETMLKNSL